MYEISRIFDFSDFLFFLMISLTFFKCRKFPKISIFPSKNAYLRSDEPGIFCGRHCFADMLCVPKDFGTPLVIKQARESSDPLEAFQGKENHQRRPGGPYKIDVGTRCLASLETENNIVENRNENI